MVTKDVESSWHDYDVRLRLITNSESWINLLIQKLTHSKVSERITRARSEEKNLLLLDYALSVTTKLKQH